MTSLLDTAVTSTEFCGLISTQFCFAYLLEGDTAMPFGLRARLCHAFLFYLQWKKYEVFFIVSLSGHKLICLIADCFECLVN